MCCCKSELYLTPCGPSWKPVLCERAPSLASGVWLNLYLPIKVCSHCSHCREGRWCKHWQHGGGITTPRVRSFHHISPCETSVFISKSRLCPSLPLSSINATFGKSCYRFYVPCIKVHNLWVRECVLLDLVQAPLELLTISFFAKSGSITLLGCNRTERKGSQKSDVFVYFEFLQWRVTIPSSS